MTELLPCPFCGAPAESDSRQGFRAIVTGNIEDAAAIYCTRCVVQMMHCYSDHPGVPREDLMADLVERWNHRHSGGDGEDAARYRWLKSRSWGGSGAYYFKGPPYQEGMTLDAAIDAARAGERG